MARQKPSSQRSKMCRESQHRGMTNFPPIAECNRLTSPPPQHCVSHEERAPHRPVTGAPSSRSRSNSDFSLGDVWSSSRRSISSSNGRSSLSLSSGDASTVASTEKIWRRRKLSPRRVIARPVTPFPAEDTLHNPPCEVGNDILAPSPPQTKSSNTAYSRRRTTCLSLVQNHV